MFFLGYAHLHFGGWFHWIIMCTSFVPVLGRRKFPCSCCSKLSSGLDGSWAVLVFTCTRRSGYSFFSLYFFLFIGFGCRCCVMCVVCLYCYSVFSDENWMNHIHVQWNWLSFSSSFFSLLLSSFNTLWSGRVFFSSLNILVPILELSGCISFVRYTTRAAYFCPVFLFMQNLVSFSNQNFVAFSPSLLLYGLSYIGVRTVRYASLSCITFLSSGALKFGFDWWENGFG